VTDERLHLTARGSGAAGALDLLLGQAYGALSFTANLPPKAPNAEVP
jgi:hypothetical protein